MTRRGHKYLWKPLLFLLAAVALEGCISPSADSAGRYTAPIGGSPVITNETPYSAALRCLNGFTRAHPITIAVGQIADYTGKTETDGSGRKVTAGAALMAMSAFNKAGVPLVERYDTSVAEMELKYANNKLIASQDGPPGDYQKILAGSITGSNYYLVGGITELNFNIRSENANGTGGGTATGATTGTIGGSMYVMNVGMDLRLVDTNSLQDVDVISYQKQIIARQVSAGLFDFLGTNFFDASFGESAQEPTQLAVRSVIERAVLEIVTRLYKIPAGACSNPLGTSADPLRDGDGQAPYYPPQPAYSGYGAPYYNPQQSGYAGAPSPQPQSTYPVNQEIYNDNSRQSPYGGYSSGDPVGDNARLRGGID